MRQIKSFDLLADIFNRVWEQREDLVLLAIQSLALCMDPPVTSVRVLLPEEGLFCLPAADATFHHGLLIVILLVAALACGAVAATETRATAF